MTQVTSIVIMNPNSSWSSDRIARMEMVSARRPSIVGALWF